MSEKVKFIHMSVKSLDEELCKRFYKFEVENVNGKNKIWIYFEENPFTMKVVEINPERLMCREYGHLGSLLDSNLKRLKAAEVVDHVQIDLINMLRHNIEFVVNGAVSE